MYINLRTGTVFQCHSNVGVKWLSALHAVSLCTRSGQHFGL